MIVIPMVGLSSRFIKAGYQQQKYMLPLWGKTVFYHAMRSFSHYFDKQFFLFIIRKDQNAEKFIYEECASLGILNAKVVILPKLTRGQAETVFEGISRISCSSDAPLTIFNIDTFRPNFRFPDIFDLSTVDGYLEVFVGSGPNWSYVLPDEDRSFGVLATAEKREISNLCCTGLYHFSAAVEFQNVFLEYTRRDMSEFDAGELYVAPLYNILIRKGLDIRYALIDFKDVVFCGVPDEYQSLLTGPCSF